MISPDGRTLAFTARYEGRPELYTMPLTGGLPTRHTYEAEASVATAWTPDGDVVYTTTHYSTLPKLQLVRLYPADGRRSLVPLAGASEAELRRYRSEAQQKALRGIRQMLSDIPKKEASRIVHLVEQADPAVLTLEQAENFGADLIVIGKHGRSLVEEMLLGSVTRHVVSDATCDVLVAQA